MRKFTALCACVLMAVLAFAQAPVRVNWTTTIEQKSDTEGEIVWSAMIEDGWHIYGMEMPQGLDIPLTLTAFEIEASPDVELIDGVVPSRQPEKHLDQVMSAEIPWWEGAVSFRQAFKARQRSQGRQDQRLVYIHGLQRHIMHQARD